MPGRLGVFAFSDLAKRHVLITGGPSPCCHWRSVLVDEEVDQVPPHEPPPHSRRVDETMS